MDRESALLSETNGSGEAVNHEAAVLNRYGEAAKKFEACLCLDVSYDKSLLACIPDEIIEKDYGCGDPSKYVRPGETVLDLGSGSGKACYIISQIVGAQGCVVGVDFNPPMLELSRKYQNQVGEKIGYSNVVFRRGKIQDLKTDLDLVDAYLKDHPVQSIGDLAKLEEYQTQIRRERPLVADDSVDVIVSNCVLNLVRADDKKTLFAEMYRVLKAGGRVAISDIVSDEAVPEHLANNADLWSACVSGALQEEDFLKAFEEAGFHGVQIEEFQAEPYQIVEGIEFRSITVTAYKAQNGPRLDRNHAVIYRGPWKQVTDDHGNTLPRGARIAVSDRTFEVLSKPPYNESLILVPPFDELPADQASVFDDSRQGRRDARETKGQGYVVTSAGTEACCSTGPACCT